ncbi:MAG: hypothetical protein DSY38_01665, partial [Fusobacteria bacterium]
ASIPGAIIEILVKKGDKVKKDQKLVIMEAMKMETTITAKTDGIVEEIFVKEMKIVEAGELLIQLSKEN